MWKPLQLGAQNRPIVHGSYAVGGDAVSVEMSLQLPLAMFGVIVVVGKIGVPRVVYWFVPSHVVVVVLCRRDGCAAAQSVVLRSPVFVVVGVEVGRGVVGGCEIVVFGIVDFLLVGVHFVVSIVVSLAVLLFGVHIHVDVVTVVVEVWGGSSHLFSFDFTWWLGRDQNVVVLLCGSRCRLVDGLVLIGFS